MSKNKVLLVGAYGYTGRIIAEKLVRAGLDFSIAGRNSHQLELLCESLGIDQWIPLDIGDSKQIKDVLGGFNVVINCVGPYTAYSTSLVEHASRNKLIYIDLCGEQHFVFHSLDQLKEDVFNAGSTLFHSFAFESCLAGLLAQEIVNGDQTYHEISSFYHFSDARPSPGTRLSMKLSGYLKSFRVSNFELIQAKSRDHHRKTTLPANPGISVALFTPYPEVLFFKEKYHVKFCGSYLLAEESVLYLPPVPQAEPNISLNDLLNQQSKIGFKGPTDLERQAQSFLILVYARALDAETRCISLRGYDMYGISAGLVCLLVEHLENHVVPPGILSPAEIFAGGSFLRKLILDCQLTLTDNEPFTIADIRTRL